MASLSSLPQPETIDIRPVKSSQKESIKYLPIASSFRWNGVGQGAIRIIGFSTSIIVARLLAPEAYGQMAMAMVVINFAEVLYELGTGSAIIQRQEISSRLLDVIFIVNVSLGLAFVLLLLILSSFFAAIYNEPELVPIFKSLSLVLLVTSAGLVHHALLRRNLEFKTLTKIEVVAATAYGTSAILLAGLGWGVWALVWSLLLRKSLLLVFLWFVSDYRPRWQGKWTGMSSVMSYCLNISVSKIINYFSRSTDRFIIGRYLGAVPLGYYSLAYRIYSYPMDFVSGSTGQVLFPVISRLGEENDKLRSVYLRACGVIAILTFPMMLTLAVLAKPLVLTFLGPRWIPSVPLISILSLVGIVRSILNTVGHIYLAKGRADWALRWNLFSSTMITLGFIVGMRWGVIGVALSYAFVVLLLAYPGFRICFKLIELRVITLLKSLGAIFLASIAMGLSMFILQNMLDSLDWPEILTILATFLAGILVYLSILIFIRPRGLVDTLQLFPKRFQETPALAKLFAWIGF